MDSKGGTGNNLEKQLEFAKYLFLYGFSSAVFFSWTMGKHRRNLEEFMNQLVTFEKKYFQSFESKQK